MPGTRLASICRAEVDQSHAHMHQTAMVHQTLQWHPPAAGKGGQLSFTKANISFQVSHCIGYVTLIWSVQGSLKEAFHWLNLDAIAATDFAKEVFQSPIPIFISSSLNDSTIWLKELLESFKTCWEIYFTFVFGQKLSNTWLWPSVCVRPRKVSAQCSGEAIHFCPDPRPAMALCGISETMHFCVGLSHGGCQHLWNNAVLSPR